MTRTNREVYNMFALLLLCFCSPFALLCFCFAYSYFHMSSTQSYIHMSSVVQAHLHVLFIENSLAKDEIASMIPSWLHGAFVHRHQDSVWENLHRSANATRHKLCAAVNGRKPAMRVSEQVHPTADLTPASYKMCKLLKFASYPCCCMQQPPDSVPRSEWLLSLSASICKRYLYRLFTQMIR